MEIIQVQVPLPPFSARLDLLEECAAEEFTTVK